jgi:hypothetical protein
LSFEVCNNPLSSPKSELATIAKLWNEVGIANNRPAEACWGHSGSAEMPFD